MKKVELTITGKGVLYIACPEIGSIPQEELDADYPQELVECYPDSDDSKTYVLSSPYYEEMAFFTSIQSIEADGEDITKKKGKYVTEEELLLKDLREGEYAISYDQNIPEAWSRFMIDLEDDEKFDPKQVQLVKSKNEFDGITVAISMYFIKYKGQFVQSVDCVEVDCEKEFDDYTIIVK